MEKEISEKKKFTTLAAQTLSYLPVSLPFFRGLSPPPPQNTGFELPPRPLSRETGRKEGFSHKNLSLKPSETSQIREESKNKKTTPRRSQVDTQGKTLFSLSPSPHHASPMHFHHRNPSPDHTAAFATATHAPHLKTSFRLM